MYNWLPLAFLGGAAMLLGVKSDLSSVSLAVAQFTSELWNSGWTCMYRILLRFIVIVS